MAKIEPLIFPILGTATDFNLSVLQFNMEDSTAKFYYQLTSEPVYGKNNLIAEGNLEMNESEFNGWGADNMYCLQWAANKLGLTLIP